MVSTWPIQFCWCMSPLLDFLVNETMIITKRKKKTNERKSCVLAYSGDWSAVH